jgi:hypothetical protein
VIMSGIRRMVKLSPLISGLSFLLVLYSCSEPKDGCLDEQALNFEVTADRNCCCEYPGLMIDLDFRWDTLDFQLNQTFVIGADSVRFTALEGFLSDFALQSSTHQGAYRVEELLVIDSPSISIIDDVIRFMPGESATSTGTFIHPGIQFDSLSFSFGLPAHLESASPELFPVGHPVRSGVPVLLDTMSQSMADFAIHFTSIEDPDLSREVLLRFSENVFLENGVTLLQVTGFDAEIHVLLDVFILLNGVDIWEDTDEDVAEKVAANARMAFQVLK